jgi:membrane-bound lytic murein transglycosylase A
VNVLEPVSFADLPFWREDDLSGVLDVLRGSCTALRAQTAWRQVCAGASTLDPSAASVREFFETRFTPWRVAASDGNVQGLITGYYEPLLHGNRERKGRYQIPLYAPPEDLLSIDLGAVNPELRNLRLRGRLVGRRVVPYYSRSDIEHGAAPLAGKELVWVNDPVEAFFMEIQGSGRVQLEDGEMLRLGYADQNGHPYVSIGRVLVQRGELPPDGVSMQGIKAWALANPDRLRELLDQNPSYVFFRELTQSAASASLGPPGALGVALTPLRSIAVDPRFIPLGVPVYLATTWPATDRTFAKLVFAQDTGGAIRGAVRADVFWGFGPEAGALAGSMRQQGRTWVFWPKGEQPPRPR